MITTISNGIAKLFVSDEAVRGWSMQFLSPMPRLQGFRISPETIAYPVWAHHRFALSTADVEDLERPTFNLRHRLSSMSREGIAWKGIDDSSLGLGAIVAERSVIFSREAICLWVNRFGAHFAAHIRRERPGPNDKWHMDDVVIPINGVKHWLWRAVDANGVAPDILVQTRRNAKAAKRFLARLIAQFGQPRGGLSQTFWNMGARAHMW